MLPINRLQNFIAQHRLFNAGNKILLAVSGGKDSVLMAYLFKAFRIDIGIAHCNFNLRVDEAQRDEYFVKMLANSLDVPFYVTHFDTKKYAAENKISTQMAARDLRYNWFEEIRSTAGYDYIALAQHQNDALETMLINLVRGTGISGLHGILPKRGRLIRPLLFLNREEINQLVDDNKFDFVEDSSNLSSDYVRNKLRLNVIPHLRDINPNLENTFNDNIKRFAEIETFLKLQVKQIAEEIVVEKADAAYISLSKIRSLNPQKLLLFELLKRYGFTESVIEEIINSLDKQSGIKFFSTSHQATINREDLVISKLDFEIYSHKIIHLNDAVFDYNNYQFELAFSEEVKFERIEQKIFVDKAVLQFPLVLRTWQNGDKFMPLGMNGFKKLSDFFIDEKVPLHLKTSIPILVNGNGEIIWITGMRQDNRYKLTNSTKKVAIFELKNY
ncbi:tRNA lysidine(34) synthetase TilS [Pedobacter sp. Leaf176]|uniref:tRNA lysidine(34) synthetase TilS n=1 Tax=Pedobacter sp. Leaf176 TaxID=1736286 RepID=UPI0006FA69AF|nr:tRNA lysidine(34) synthetase TilS [Pedobacter sp. Leaf176]KQR69887.1 tRNA(Ile)-lysidine synthetase [Pedobacter sp. Leaf176]